MKAKYEKIGSWNVDLRIPEKARALLRAEFDRWQNEGVSHEFVLTHLNVLAPMRCRSSWKGLFNEAMLPTNLRTPQQREEALAYACGWMKDNMELLKRTCRQEAYLEHMAWGSTSPLTPDPFVEPYSYLDGNLRDVYDRVRKLYTGRKIEKMTQPESLWIIDPFDAFIADVSSPLERAVDIKMRVDIKNRECFLIQ